MDAQDNGATNIVVASLCRHQKFIALSGHVYPLHAHLFGDRILGPLGNEEPPAITQGLEIARVVRRGMTTAQAADAERILRVRGMTVQQLNATKVDAFRNLAQAAVRTWLDGGIGRKRGEKLLADTVTA